MPEILILDTETNRIENPAEVIEIACLRYQSIEEILTYELSPDVSNRFTKRFDCYGPIEVAASAVHHIFKENLKGLDFFDTDVPPDAEYLIGHNIDFDWQAIGSPKIKRICTLAMARYFYPELTNHKLVTLMYYFHGSSARPLVQQAHGALADVIMCARILAIFLAKALEQEENLIKDGFSKEILSIEDLWEFSEFCRIPRVMPFGVHKGKPLAEVPFSYIQWLLRQPDVDPLLEKEIRKIFFNKDR